MGGACPAERVVDAADPPGDGVRSLDNYPRCGVWPETSLGLMTAPHVWYRVGESTDGFVEWKCRRCRAVAVGVNRPGMSGDLAV